MEGVQPPEPVDRVLYSPSQILFYLIPGESATWSEVIRKDNEGSSEGLYLNAKTIWNGLLNRKDR